MAKRRSNPSTTNSAGVALTLLGMCFCLPANAATPAATIEETAAAMERNDSAPARLPTPQAAANIRNAFLDNDETALERRRASLSERVSGPSLMSIVENDADTEADESADEKSETNNGMRTRLPGVSSEELIRYKKVMFRRDI